MKNKNIARIKILSWLAQFSFPIKYSSGPISAYTCFTTDREPAVGSLVAIQSAPDSKWYLSWLNQIEEGGAFGSKRYLLESIEDGGLCWWENVGMLAYDAKTVAEHPEWRWTDAQHKFNQQWLSVCKTERDAYITLPVMVKFDGDSVTLATRTRFGMDDYIPSKTFKNWRTVTKKQMLAFYDSAVAAKPAPRPTDKVPSEIHFIGGVEIAITTTENKS